MPTRKRRLREAAQKEERERFDESMRSPPQHILNARAEGTSHLNDIVLANEAKFLADPNNWPHKLNGGLTAAEEDGNLALNRSAIDKGLSKSSANRYAAQARRDKALDLRQRHSDVWGKRGKAAIVLQREMKRAPDEKLSVRTIQQYMKDFPL